MTTTLEQELLQAAEDYEDRARVAGDPGWIHVRIYRERAARLRQRAAWVRELLAGPRGALSIAQQLTGPDIPETAPAAAPAAEPGKPPECGHVYGNRVCISPAGHDREGENYRSHVYVDTIWAKSRNAPAAGPAEPGTAAVQTPCICPFPRDKCPYCYTDCARCFSARETPMGKAREPSAATGTPPGGTTP